MSHNSSISSSIHKTKEFYCDCSEIQLHGRHEPSCPLQHGQMPFTTDTPRSESQPLNQVMTSINEKHSQNDQATAVTVMPKKNQRKSVTLSNLPPFLTSELNFDSQQLPSFHTDPSISLSQSTVYLQNRITNSIK